MILKDQLSDAILNYEEDVLKELCKTAIKNRELTAIEIVNIIGDIMAKLGERYEKEEIMLPELIVAANIVKDTIDEIIDPAIRASGEKRESKGKVVIGTVESDVHSIGKDLVASFLFSNGYDVYNIGVDIPADVFIEKAEEVQADIIGLSSLITLSMDFQKQVIDELVKRGLRDKFKVIVGGAPTSEDWAKKIGADAWADDSLEAVIKIDQLLGNK
ncbi:MAG: Trimethylamine corrinoid protein MtbC1 [Promethearchaeota archaeon]|nr:MAG: Trimethylamine corrinoid protein MtbC1 [Candidatus Lokiarchaeota archaeon]